MATFRKAANALGAIGFSQSVDWVDSAVFILAMLLRLQSEGLFQLKRGPMGRPFKKVIDEMCEGPYASLAAQLGVEKSFAK